MRSVIEISNLQHVFKQGNSSLQILNNINLTFNEGEFVALLGKSGSGKSTLLNLIAGFMKPTSGSIHVLGTDITKLKENKLAIFRQNRIGFIFQGYNLIATQTAFENIELPLELYGEKPSTRKDKVAKVLKDVDLAHRANHYPNELSGGEQQRVAIARALVGNAKIILADEPTGNLDVETEKDIIKLLRRINQTYNITFVIVTHDAEIALKADRVIRLEKGCIFEAKSMLSKGAQ